MKKYNFPVRLIAVIILLTGTFISLFAGQIVNKHNDEMWVKQAVGTAEKATNSCLSWFSLQQAQLRSVASLFYHTEGVSEDEFLNVLDLIEVPGSLPFNSVAFAEKKETSTGQRYIVTLSSDEELTFQLGNDLAENEEILAGIETAYRFPGEVVMCRSFTDTSGNALSCLLILINNANQQGVLAATINVPDLLGDLATLYIPDGLYLQAITITSMADSSPQQNFFYQSTRPGVASDRQFSIRVDSGKAHLKYLWHLTADFSKRSVLGYGGLIQITGILLSVLLFSLLYLLDRENKRVQEKVAERTAELSEAVEEIHSQIIEKNHTEQALKETTERLKALSDASFEAIFLSENGICIDLNQTAVDMFGYSREEALGAHAATIFPTANLPEIVFRLEREDSSSYETVAKRKDGTLLTVLLRGKTIKHRGKKIRITAISNITQIKKVKKERLEYQDRLVTFMETIPDAVFIKDGGGRWLLTNQVGRNLFHLDKYSWQGKTDQELGIERPDYKAAHDHCILSDELAWGTPGITIDYEEVIDDAGMVHIFEVRKMPKFTTDGKRKTLVIIGRNITDQRNAEQEKAKLTEQLHQAKKMESIGLLAGGVAHDLNNILSGIIGYPELLLQELPADSPLRDPIETIQQSGQRAAAVVDDLLTVARGVATTKETYDLNLLAQEYLQSPEYKKLMSLHPEVDFQYRFDAEKPAILCSTVHVKKCLMNLVTNGAEAVDGSGIVGITTRNQVVDEQVGHELDIDVGNYVVLTIQDSGTGISSANLEHIFEPFYSSKKMGTSGTGLGLTVVWNTMEVHEGKVLVSSTDQGTVFSLYFPLSSEQQPLPPLDSPEEDAPGHGERILVVDDEALLRDIAVQMLQVSGYNVDSVSSGEAAIAYIQKHPVDVVILDMIMEPGINGRQTYQEMLKINPEQKAIVASGFSESEDVIATRELGATGFIKKPYSMKMLTSAVKDALQNGAHRVDLSMEK